MALKLYGVTPSQPTRAIMFLCAIKKYPFEIIKTSPAAHTASKQTYIESINPTGKIPGIAIRDSNDNEFTLYESAAIMTYLCSLNHWNDLYPSTDDLQRRALIDQYLYWHQENTRAISTGFIRPLLQSSFRSISDWDPNLLVRDRNIALNALRIIDKYRLNGHEYIVDDALSIADIACYEEVVQLKEWNFILNKQKMDTEKEFPNIYAWVDRMRGLEGHDETHKVIETLKPWLMDRLKEYESLYDKVDSLM
eukprot:273089_1